MKRWTDERSHCATCTHHWADHTGMTGPCRHTVWERSTATHVCECRAFVFGADRTAGGADASA